MIGIALEFRAHVTLLLSCAMAAILDKGIFVSHHDQVLPQAYPYLPAAYIQCIHLTYKVSRVWS
jgi:hypothetical protein